MDEQTTGLKTSNANDLRKRTLYDVYFSGGNIEWYFGYHALPLGGDLRTEDFRTRENMWAYMWYARKFMHDHLPFWEMEPADGLITGETPTNGGAEVFAKHGQVYAIYYPSTSNTGTMLLPSGEYNLRWFDPTTGLFDPNEHLLNGGPSTVIGNAPASGDWVALVQRISQWSWKDQARMNSMLSILSRLQAPSLMLCYIYSIA